MYSKIKTSKGYSIIDTNGIYFFDKDEDYEKEVVKLNEISKSCDVNNKLEKESVSKVAIFLTEECNLRCIYCYANSGKENIKVSIKNAKQLIDFVAQKSDNIILDFHGGGEPLLHFDIIKELYEYVKSIGKLYKTVLITNGCIEKDKNEIIDWIVENIDMLSISCDGYGEIQNRNRPYKDGINSSKNVEDTIKQLVSKNYNFTVRSTITDENCDKLEKIIKYFDDLGVKNVIFSPCYNFGRSSDINLLPNPKKYSNSFMKAFEYAYNHNMTIRTNSFRIPGRDYCGALPGFNLALTTDNYISTCYEVINSKDKEGDMFIIGKISDEKIYIFEDKIINLSNIDNYNKNCKSCKFKMVCRGGCPIKHARNNEDASKNLCKITHTLVPKILDFIHENPDSYKTILKHSKEIIF